MITSCSRILIDKYLTLKERVENNGGKLEDKKAEKPEGDNAENKEQTTIYYVTDEKQQSQYINMFKCAGTGCCDPVTQH